MTKTYLTITILVIFISILISSMASSNVAGISDNYQFQNQTPVLTITLLPTPSTAAGTRNSQSPATIETLSTPIGPQPEYSNQVRVIITFGVMTVFIILIGLGINRKRIR